MISDIIRVLVERFRSRFIPQQTPEKRPKPEPVPETPPATGVRTEYQTGVVVEYETQERPKYEEVKEKEVVMVNPPPGTTVYRPSGVSGLYLWVSRDLPGLRFTARLEDNYAVVSVYNSSQYTYNMLVEWTNTDVEDIRQGLIEPSTLKDILRVKRPGDVRLYAIYNDCGVFPLKIYCHASVNGCFTLCDFVELKVVF